MQRVLNAPHLAESIHIMQSANHCQTRNERMQALKTFRAQTFCRNPWCHAMIPCNIWNFTVCRTFFQRRRHKDGRRRKVYMIRYAICSLWEVDDTGRAIESGPQATGETDYQPLPHKEQKMDRTCKSFYTACRSGRRRPFLLAPWPATEHQNLQPCRIFLIAMADDDTHL
jgi:hypothetical protein